MIIEEKDDKIPKQEAQKYGSPRGNVSIKHLLLYANLDTIEKADAKKKTEFWHTEAFRTYVLIRVRLYILNSCCMNVLLSSHTIQTIIY